MAEFHELLAAAERTEVCVAKLPGFIPPKQIRTQKKTDLIVSSLALLLQTKGFDEISVQEIAEAAGCSVTTIYARFVDKRALLPAVNLIILEHYSGVISSLIDRLCHEYKDMCSAIEDIIGVNFSFYCDNRNFFSAVFRVSDGYIMAQVNANLEIHGERLVRTLVTSAGHSGKDRAKIAMLKSTVRLLHSVFRDSIMCCEEFGGEKQIEVFTFLKNIAMNSSAF